MVGDIYLGTVEAVLPGIQAAFVNIGAEKSAFLTLRPDRGDGRRRAVDHDDDNEKMVARERGGQRSTRTPGAGCRTSRTSLKRGEARIVQVIKEPISTKVRASPAQISLAGRFLVYMPFASKVGVSRKIENREQRAKLREMVSQARCPRKRGRAAGLSVPWPKI